MKIEVERNMDASFEGGCQSCGANSQGHFDCPKIEKVNVVRIHTMRSKEKVSSYAVAFRLCNECLPKFAEDVTGAINGGQPIQAVYPCVLCGVNDTGPGQVQTCSVCRGVPFL